MILTGDVSFGLNGDGDFRCFDCCGYTGTDWRTFISLLSRSLEAKDPSMVFPKGEAVAFTCGNKGRRQDGAGRRILGMAGPNPKGSRMAHYTLDMYADCVPAVMVAAINASFSFRNQIVSSSKEIEQTQIFPD